MNEIKPDQEVKKPDEVKEIVVDPESFAGLLRSGKKITEELIPISLVMETIRAEIGKGVIIQYDEFAEKAEEIEKKILSQIREAEEKKPKNKQSKDGRLPIQVGDRIRFFTMMGLQPHILVHKLVHYNDPLYKNGYKVEAHVVVIVNGAFSYQVRSACHRRDADGGRNFKSFDLSAVAQTKAMSRGLMALGALPSQVADEETEIEEEETDMDQKATTRAPAPSGNGQGEHIKDETYNILLDLIGKKALPKDWEKRISELLDSSETTEQKAQEIIVKLRSLSDRKDSQGGEASEQ